MDVEVTHKEYREALLRNPALRLRQKFDVVMELQRLKYETMLEKVADDREREVIEDILG